jgi:hypothetical protein
MHVQEKEALIGQMEQVTSEKPQWQTQLQQKMKEMVAKSMESQ